jgi:hypothetical protein
MNPIIILIHYCHRFGFLSASTATPWPALDMLQHDESKEQRKKHQEQECYYKTAATRF